MHTLDQLDNLFFGLANWNANPNLLLTLFFSCQDDSSFCLSQNSLTFLFFALARIMLDSMRVIQLSHSLGYIELFMGLMFLIPSLILSLPEQI